MLYKSCLCCSFSGDGGRSVVADCFRDSGVGVRVSEKEGDDDGSGNGAE